MRARSVLASLLTLVVAQAGAPYPAAAQPGVLTLDGRPAAVLDPPASVTVVVFTGVECPISGRYAPAIRRLADRYADRGVRFWLAYPNEGESAASVRAHAEAFSPGMPAVIDSRRALADRADVAVTPEAAVFDRDGRLRYRGRIDDRYTDFGVDRPVPTSHDLDDALAAVIAGRAVVRPVVPAVGCAIVRHRP